MFGKIDKTFRLGVFLFAAACLAAAPVLSQAFEQPDPGSQWSQASSGAPALETADCNSDGQPDDPTDCNNNGEPDVCDIVFNRTSDCNSNGIPDECEVPTGGSDFCYDAPYICPDVTYAGTLEGKTFDPPGYCSTNGDARDVWYRYVPAIDCGNVTNSTLVNISISACSDSFVPLVSVHSECPGVCDDEKAAGPRGEWDCLYDPCATPAVVTVEINQTYYISVAAADGPIGDGRYTLEITSGGGGTLCCAIGPENPTGGDDCNSNGVLDDCELTRTALFSVDYDKGLLREINQYTGETQKIIVPSLQGRMILGGVGLDQNPTTGELWAVLWSYSTDEFGSPRLTIDRGGEGEFQDLVRIDPRTGKAQIVGPIDFDYDIRELAFNTDGTRLFAVTGENGLDSESLFELSQSDASMTFLTALTSGGQGEAIAFNDEDGLIYRLGGIEPNLTLGPAGQVFETIDPGTLAISSLEGPTAYSRPAGMTYNADDGKVPFFVADDPLLKSRGVFNGSLWRQSAESPAFDVGGLDHLASGLALAVVDEDCNSNGIPDECDIADQTSLDCNLNGVPDECEDDCNSNGIPDECEIGGLYSADGDSCCSDGYIHVLDPTTAETRRVITVFLAESGWDMYGIKGLARNPLTGELFGLIKAYDYGNQGALSGGTWLLCKINRFNGLATIIRNMGDYYQYAGLAFDDTGRLFAVTGDGGSDPETLFELDPEAGWESLRCDFGRGDSGETLAFNADNGLLYHASGDSYSSNVATGDPEPQFGQIFESLDVPVGGKAAVTIDCTTTDIPLSGNEQVGRARALTWWAEEGVFLFTGGGLHRLTSDGVVTFIGDLNHTSKGLVYIAGTASDCNGDGIPDDCEPDCDENGIPDACEIRDCDGSPACGDCNFNGIPDGCDLAEGIEEDCNENGVPDSCELGDDYLYSIDKNNDMLRIFDKDTGESLWDVTITMADQYVYDGSGLAVNPVTGELWGIVNTAESGDESSRSDDHRHLAIIDPLTGVATDIGRIADRNNNRKFGAIAFDSAGTLYGLTGASGTDSESLFTFDQSDATATLFLELPEICSDGGFAMAYNPEDGRLYRASDLLIEEEIGTVGGCTPSLEAIDISTLAIETFELSGNEVNDFKAMTWDAEAGRFLLAARGYPTPTSQPATAGERGLGDTAFFGVSATGEASFLTYYYPTSKGLAFLNPYRGSDCNSNGVLDVCETDCNSNGIPDDCDIANETSTDCNSNGIPDECDAALALGACPDTITIQATDAGGIVVQYPTPPASGGCSPVVTVDPPSGTLFPVGTTTVTVTATDQLGNELSCSFDVVVLGPDAPGGGENPPPGGQPTPPGGFCLPFLFQTLCGVPLCAGPCFAGGMLSSIIGIFGLRVLVRRRYRRRR